MFIEFSILIANSVASAIIAPLVLHLELMNEMLLYWYSIYQLRIVQEKITNAIYHSRLDQL